MATSKKNPASAVPTEAAPVVDQAQTVELAPAAAPVQAAAEPAAKKQAAAKPAVAKPAAARSEAKRAAKPAKAAKPLEPSVQASKEALAKALAAAQAVKITKPLGKPAKADKAEKPVKAEKSVKAVKPRKAKLVRDSFTMPEAEYEQIAGLKKRLLAQGVVAKKSELLRAGVALLAGLDDGGLAAAMRKVEIIKTGRPAKTGK